MPDNIELNKAWCYSCHYLMENKKAAAKLTLSIIVLLLLCISTFSALSDVTTFNVTGILSNFIFNLPIILLVGYVDYILITYRQKKRHCGIGLSLLVDFTTTAVFFLVLETLAAGICSFLQVKDFYSLKNLLAGILLNCMVVSLIEIFLYHKSQLENEMKLNIAEKEKAVYQFETLKNQINPHFLFNSLNVLSSLAYQDAEKANLFAKKLSSVYRYLLAIHERETVTLQEEMQFVDSYLYLEKIRFGDTLQIHIEYNKKSQDKAVFPASLQMLVENAIKHNISTPKSPLVIHIKIDTSGITVSNNLQLRNYVIRNGMGLNNLKKQYLLHKQEINIIKTETNFTVKLPFVGI